MGLFDIFSKKPTIKEQMQHTKTNLSGEPLDKLVNGELPWGWVANHRDFTEKINSQHNYFLDLWLDSRNKSPKEQYSSLKSFVLFLNDCKKLCASQGECHLKWFQDIIADDSYIQARTEELKEIEKNFEKLEADYEKRQNIEKNILPSLQQDLLAFITTNPNVLQKDIYNYFPPSYQEYISEALYNLRKNGEVVREKSGNTYKLYLP